MDVEYKVITDAYIVQNVRTERFAKLRWSPDEQHLKNRPNHVHDFFKNRQVPFSLLSRAKFKHSIFGIFLHAHNKTEVQNYFLNDNKLAMMKYDLTTYSENRLKHHERHNDFGCDLKDLLERAVSEKEVIDYDFLYDNIYALKFCDTPLTFIDSELSKFRHLKILILCANWITDITGSCLPRTLEYIELFANQIEYFHNFAKKPPRRLIHIGMKRNWLTNDSRLHLLVKGEKFEYLQSLDLAENDIYNLMEILRIARELSKLLCLQLQGNPCSVISCYKDEVLRYIPWLEQLDYTEIIDKDRQPPDCDEDYDAAIIFTCHRIMGLPKPKKEKGVEQWFYLSVGMPLLEDVIEVKEPENEDILKEPEPVDTSRSVDKKTKSKILDSSGNKLKSNAVGIYNAPDEYAEEMKQRVVDTTFKTKRFEWDKIIQLPEDALIIKSTERNFADIRDTFRSSVCVKLIYLEVKLMKAKTDVKKKGKSNKSKASSVTVENEEIPRETIAKKVTIAQFYCDLHSINWSDKTIDFIWADTPKFESLAVEVEGSLRSLEYSDKPKQKGGQTKKPDMSEINEAPSSERLSMATDVTTPQEQHPIPKALTIQIGFGLQRTYYQT